MDYLIFWAIYGPFSLLWHMNHELGDKAIDLFVQFAQTGLGDFILNDLLIKVIEAMHALNIS